MLVLAATTMALGALRSSGDCSPLALAGRNQHPQEEDKAEAFFSGGCFQCLLSSSTLGRGRGELEAVWLLWL